MNLLIKGGTVLNPAESIFSNLDLLITNGKISKIAPHIESRNAEVINAGGKIISPGLIDLHVHLRQPGGERKETIKTGCASAAAGGFTSIACMPNTDPAVDNHIMVEYVKGAAEKEGVVKVYPIGAISKGLKGEELAEMGLMSESGIVAVSDDGRPVDNSSLMFLALQYAKTFDLPVISHCEVTSLAEGGMMNEGYTSTVLGLRGIPDVAEAVMVARDILLAEYTGAHLHIAHVSSAKSVELIRQAKAKGLKVTAEVTPHHLILTEEDVGEFDTDAKMNPPLRTAEDRKALRKALKDGTIDIIATDHAPHTPEEKSLEFDAAPFGVVGLETALPLIFTELVKPGYLTLGEAISAMTIKPAKVLGIKAGIIEEGAEADLTIIDINAEKIIDKEKFYSRGRNTPFQGWKVRGIPYMTIVRGKVIMHEGKVYF